MKRLTLTIDEITVAVAEGTSILEAAQSAGIYIPAVCHHPDLPAFDSATAALQMVYQGAQPCRGSAQGYQGCQVCLIDIEGDGITTACNTPVRNGIVVRTRTSEIEERRRQNLSKILSEHPHACLVCPQREGCDLKQCSSNVPENERCCSQFPVCELRKVSEHVGLRSDVPRYVPRNLARVEDDPLFNRDYNLCIGCTRCVRVCNEVRGIGALGFTHDAGKTVVGAIASTLRDSGCKFCTACVEVCPTGALVDKAVRPGKKEEDIVPCSNACPASIDIPGYLRLVGVGKADEAHAVIREKVPFPGVLGRICIRPCEEVCRRGEVNEPVAICALKRYAADYEQGRWKAHSRLKGDTGERVAVVGAGPAGLTAAFYLRKQGHGVTLFESRCKPGGMMRYGIPSYRLPEAILDEEIQRILELGIDLRTNQTLGKDFTLEQLRDSGFSAVFLGIGAQLSRRIDIEGSDLGDVFWGLDFLVRIAEGEDLRVKDTIVVIGGGNVAIDVALSALRLGAKEVTMACLEARDEMPAHEWEIEGALEEGVRLMPGWGPCRVLSKDGRATGIEARRCTSVFDEKGNFSPTFDVSTRETIKADQIIMAIGQACDLSFIGEDCSLRADKGLIVVDEASLKTQMQGVYAGGDVVKVPGSIIHAIAAGRKAAASIDRALGGGGEIDEVLFQRDPPNLNLGRDEGFADWVRESVPTLEVGRRRQGFQEILFGYDTDQAMHEAKRCLQCDLRLQIAPCSLPPEKWIAFSADNVATVPETEGVFHLFDGQKNIIYIKGALSLREELEEQLGENKKAQYFLWEEDPMFTKRESELLQQFMQQYGKLPEGNAALDDDLF